MSTGSGDIFKYRTILLLVCAKESKELGTICFPIDVMHHKVSMPYISSKRNLEYGPEIDYCG